MDKFYSVDWDLDELPNCCGVLEAGSFDEFEGEPYPNGIGRYPSLDEAWEEALEQIRIEADKKPIIFNFAQNQFTHEWCENSLRKLVILQPDCLFVHKWINPGTGNTIEQYLLKNGSMARRSKKS